MEWVIISLFIPRQYANCYRAFKHAPLYPTSHVLAIDTAKLHPNAAKLPNVTHIALKLEKVLESPTWQLLLATGISVLVCDINQQRHASLEIIKPYLRYVVPGGLVVVTIKLPGTGRYREDLDKEI